VFAARTGVCAGYAKLMVALGKAAGAEIAYVTGYIRDPARRTTAEGTDDTIKSALEGYSHAWNAAKIDQMLAIAIRAASTSYETDAMLDRFGRPSREADAQRVTALQNLRLLTWGASRAPRPA